ncbi:MAG: SDR family NAD(P)-dependent oxidoreductase [Ruminococcaceae bacterium]|nr:SDR family NAD(P)-dependent oxidoreductase [Oscillospiraceae bacterium]
MKYAFITGAAGGLAGACVEELIRRGGWIVFAADFNVEGLNELVAKTSSDVIPIELDVTSMDSCNAAADKIREHTDHLDCIINAAGICTMASLVEEDPVGIISRMIDINVMGMIRVNKALFDLVYNCKGRIINFSSECGRFQPQPFNTPYAITKYAVEAYTIGLRRELNFVDVPVIKIQPGPFKTGLLGQAESGYDKLIASTTHFKPVLSVLKPLMTVVLDHPNDKKYLVETVMEAMYAAKPKVNYRSKHTWYLALIDPIPAKIMDAGYKLVVNIGWKLLNKK